MEETGNLVDITHTKVGAIIRYPSSKKLYIVATLVKNSNIESRLLFSYTQNFNSTINNFKVYQLIAGTGEITNEIAGEYDKLVEGEFRFKKNACYKDLYNKVQQKLKRAE
jgi:hypothetical protein